MERKRKQIRSTRKMPVDGKMQCTKCKEWKELDCFSPNRSRPCGVSCHCKPCQAEYTRNAYRKDPAKVIERTRQWIRSKPEKSREYLDKYAEKKREASLRRHRLHRAKSLANKTVNNAIRAGKLERKPCEVCGKEKADGHHWSYLREHWLDVKWLCRTHHLEEHYRLKREGIQIEVPTELTTKSE